MKKVILLSLSGVLLITSWYCGSGSGFGVAGLYLDMDYQDAKEKVLSMFKSEVSRYEIFDKNLSYSIQEKVRGLDFADIEIMGSFNQDLKRKTVYYVKFNEGAVKKFICPDKITAKDFISDYIDLSLKREGGGVWKYKKDYGKRTLSINVYETRRGLSLMYRWW